MSDHDTATTPPATHPEPRTVPGDPGATARAESGWQRVLDDVQRVLRAGWDIAARLIRQGNRRRVTLRSREGEVWARMPLTLTLLVVALLLPAWPLLVVLVVVGFAAGAQLSVERHASAPDEAVPSAPDGAA
jgi:hypothetical protein